MTRWAARLVPPLVLLAVTALAAYSGFRADHNASRQRANAASVRSVASIESLTDGLSQRISDVAGLFEASDKVSSREFGIYAKPVVRSSQASAIGWAEVVQGKDRAKFERQHHLKIMTLTPSGRRIVAPKLSRYVVATYAVRRGQRGGTLGLNLDSTRERHRALVTAAKAGSPVGTPPIKFSDGHLGISLYMPVYGNKGAGHKAPVGYTIGAFRFDDLQSALTGRLAGTAGTDLSYRGATPVAIGKRPSGAEVVSRKIDIAGEEWTVRSWAPSGGIGLGWVFLGAGLLLTILITLLTNLLLRSNSRGRELAEARAREHELMVVMQERKSAAAEERFGQIFESATIGMALMGIDGRYTRVNEAFCRLVARDASELVGLSPQDITHPDDLGTAQESIEGLVSGAQTEFEVDKRYVDGNGKVVWAALRAKGLLNADGETEMVLIQALDISERRQQVDNLQHMADHDGLTGLPNRRAFNAALGQQLSVVRRYGPDGALFLIDLDNFKQVNDVHGHSAGDVVLRRVADVIREQLRDSDFAGRLGGDEFAVMLPKGGVSDVAVVADRLVKALAAMGSEYPHEGVPDVTCSVGVAMLMPGSASVNAVSELADAAMYEAKANGRNGFVVSAEGLADMSQKAKH